MGAFMSTCFYIYFFLLLCISFCISVHAPSKSIGNKIKPYKKIGGAVELDDNSSGSSSDGDSDNAESEGGEAEGSKRRGEKSNTKSGKKRGKKLGKKFGQSGKKKAANGVPTVRQPRRSRLYANRTGK